jgi:lysophospholipase L1-like esterase
MMKPGDAVVIQFGHNDGGPINDDSRARGSIRGAGDQTEQIDNLLTKQPETVRTYGAYLRQYLADTRAKGATPYLCTQVPRKMWEADGPRISRPTDGTVVWARQVAAAEKATLLDLHEAVAASYDARGRDSVEPFFADARTHTTIAGADHTARIVVGLLKTIPDSPWGDRLSPAAAKVPEVVHGLPADPNIIP